MIVFIGALVAQLWGVILLTIAMDICLVVARWRFGTDREERLPSELKRQRSDLGPQYSEYSLPQGSAVQEAEDLESSPRAERSLQAHITEREDQFAEPPRNSEGYGDSPASQRVDEKQAAENVAVLEIRRGVQAIAEETSETKATDKQPIERSASQPRSPEQQAEQEDLVIRRKATQVLMAALDDAVAKGVLTQEDYQAKRSSCNRELRRLNRRLRESSKKDAAS